MAEPHSTTTASHPPQFYETLTSSSPFSSTDLRRDTEPPKPADHDGDEPLSSLCIPGSKLVRTGSVLSACSDNEPVMFVNAGGEGLLETSNVGFQVEGDKFFQGGNVIRTDEAIEGSDMPSIYQSARFGNFAYRFENWCPGDYFVDLHFSEIVYTNGPKGMRVMSEIDIYSFVGANKALQALDVRVSVGEDGVLVIRFEGVNGSPIVSGICIKRPRLSASKVNCGNLVCNNCAAEIEISSGQEKYIRMQFIAKYEKKIEELKTWFQLKIDECHEAWMSLTTANKQLQDITMELDNKSYTIHCLGQAREETEAKFRDISGKYEHDKRMWTAVVDKLEREVRLMKQEYYQLYCEVHKCADAVPELSNMVSAVQAMGNIRVFCRCRPLRKEESPAGHATVVQFDAAKDGELGIISSGSNKKIFKFDRVYTPEDDQADVFADASPMITSVLDGYNVCIFAYGQTGTGKTFTMEGPESNRGVNYRTLEQLFIAAEERKEIFTYNISVSVLEVYNEQIRDLLATSSTSKKLEMRQSSEGTHHVPGLIEAKVENIKEVWRILQAGSNARATGSNNVNEHSSRSHCMLCIMVRAKNMMTGNCTMSKLWLVDLAGSERLVKTEVQGERLKEAQNINRSLSALGDVISALAAKKSHIPYRNSKLTRLLQDSLGGDAKTLMFVQISPSEQDLNETLSSLNFAARVQGVELGPAKKQVDTGEVQKLRNQNDKLKQELRSKEDALRKVEENFQNLENKAKGDYQMCRSQQDKIDELEKQIVLKIDLSRRLENQLLQANEKAEAYLDLQRKVKELEHKQKENEHAYPMILHEKVKDLENKLKERTRELEHHSAVAQWKVQELEEKLAMKENNKGFQLLQQKVKELEEKLRWHERERASLAFSTENSETTCLRHETVGDVNPLSQRSFSYINQMTDHGSALLKVPESLHEIRRKRELQSKGHENFVQPATLTDGKMFSGEPNRGKSGTHKALARISRSIKPGTTQKSYPNIRNDRDQVPSVKSRIWLR
ncbi:hypothetical protein ACLB2K_046813 [Fragaria x ananassa]